jgi:hypothetical protein
VHQVHAAEDERENAARKRHDDEFQEPEWLDPQRHGRQQLDVAAAHGPKREQRC